MDKINICICTYKRGALLKKCLTSLYETELPKDVSVSITVIDNDDKQSARIIVDELSATSPLPTHYFCESKRGIPCARNRAIMETQKIGANYLVFIDDDEWVTKDWLIHLYSYCIKKGGKVVVSGDVIPEIPAETPNEIKPFLYRENKHPTGTSLTSCATNNVLMPTSISKDLDLWFDESQPYSGGEDTIFFSTANRLGIRIEKCTEAIVKEHIPVERTKIKWLANRKFWVGTVNAWRKRQKGKLWINIFISSFTQLLWHSLLIPIMWLTRQKTKRNKAILKVSRAAGEVCGLFGYRIKSY